VKQQGSFYGVVYAPGSDVKIDQSAEMFGSFVGKSVEVRDRSRVHYDASLSFNVCWNEPELRGMDAAAVLDGSVKPGEWLRIDTGNLSLGDFIEINDEPVLVSAVVGGTVIQIPPDLPPYVDLEVAVVDLLGCRAKRSIRIAVEPPVEAFACSNGLDDDGDGQIDFGQDDDCGDPNDDTEGRACGLGVEQVVVIPMLWAAWRRKRR
jgi:hypothetical protein